MRDGYNKVVCNLQKYWANLSANPSLISTLCGNDIVPFVQSASPSGATNDPWPPGHPISGLCRSLQGI